MSATFSTRYLSTPRGSTLALYEMGSTGPQIIVVGGLSARPVCEGPLKASLEAAVARGARCTMVDLAARGRSTHRGRLTMDTWFDDLEFVAAPLSHADTLFIGASVGAWLMLALHERRRLPLGAMCALAAAVDWDTTFVMPGIDAGRLTRGTEHVMAKDVAMLPLSVLDSMEGFRLEGRPFVASAPLHMIHGDGDDALYGAALQMSGRVVGSECTFESLAGEGHEVAKLASEPSRRALGRWLDARVC